MTRKCCRATLAAWLLVCHLAAAFAPGLGPSPAQAQEQSSKPPIERGQEYYEQARFDEAITLLKDLVDRGALSGEDLLNARQILARSYVKKGNPVLAKDTFKAILRDDPIWRPDPIRVPPDETAVFEQALAEFQTEAAPPPATSTPAAPDTTGVMPGVAETVPPPKPEKKSLLSRWWFWAAAGAAAVGIAIAAGGGDGDGGDGDDELPGFPDPP